MTKYVFNEELADEAAGMIPRLSNEEREAVVSVLRDMGNEINEPDMTIKKARAKARSIKKAISKVRALTRELHDGWGFSFFMLPQEIVQYTTHLQSLEKIEADADKMLERLLKTKQKFGTGGLITQERRALPKDVAIAGIVRLWFDATLEVPRNQDGVLFVEVAWEAVSGEPDGKGLSHILPTIFSSVREVTHEEAIRSLEALDGIEARSNIDWSFDPELHKRDNARKVLRSRYRRLLDQVLATT